MTRLIHHREMTASEIIQTSYDAMAIVSLCKFVANDLSERSGSHATLLGEIGTALKLAESLMEVVHGIIEMHEPTKQRERVPRDAGGVTI